MHQRVLRRGAGSPRQSGRGSEGRRLRFARRLSLRRCSGATATKGHLLPRPSIVWRPVWTPGSDREIAGEEALRRAGSDPAELARFYAQQGRFDEATRAIAAAIAAAPDRSAPRVFYGLLQEATGRRAEAADTFAAASRTIRTESRGRLSGRFAPVVRRGAASVDGRGPGGRDARARRARTGAVHATRTHS